jgi:hypothetical protein
VKNGYKKVIAVLLVVFMVCLAVPTMGLAANITAKPVAHYTFDGDFKDSSGNGNDGNVLGDVSFADDGVIGKSAVFNGGYINVKSVPGLNLGNNFTVSAWVKIDTGEENHNNNAPIITKLDDAGNYNTYNFSTRGAFNVRIDMSMKNGDQTLTGGVFDDYAMEENWTHLVWTCDGQAMYLYVNGVQKGMNEIKSDDSIVSSESNMRIGCANDINSTTSLFKGKMDELRIYDVGLNAADIKALYNSGGAFNHKIVLQLENPKMVVDNVEKYIDSVNRTEPIIIENRTMVPIRAIIENMGGTVAWNAAEKRIDLTLKSQKLTLWVDRLTADLDGNQLNLDVPPKVIRNRTLVPLRFVSENLGCKVEWDGTTKKVTLLYSK